MGRLRTNTKAPELIKNFPNYINLETFKVPKQSVHLEIGCGKGDFLIQKALQYPDITFIGIEKYSTVILKALKKIEEKHLKLNSLFFTCLDAKNINIDKFKRCFSKLFLNFSDPWPKKRHSKRRLTSPNFLILYKELLKADSTIEFKTDNNGLYKYTLDTLNSFSGIKVIYHTNDLYKDIKNPINSDNIQTEYERKFVLQNKKINKIIWKYIYDN